MNAEPVHSTIGEADVAQMAKDVSPFLHGRPPKIIAGVAEVLDSSDCQRQDHDPFCIIHIRIAEVLLSTAPEKCATGSDCKLIILTAKDPAGHTSDRARDRWLLVADPVHESKGEYRSTFKRTCRSEVDEAVFRAAVSRAAGD